MVVNGILYSNFRAQLDLFSKFYDLTTIVVFRQNLTHVVVKWSPSPQCMICIVTLVFYSNSNTSFNMYVVITYRLKLISIICFKKKFRFGPANVGFGSVRLNKYWFRFGIGRKNWIRSAPDMHITQYSTVTYDYN